MPKGHETRCNTQAMPRAALLTESIRGAGGSLWFDPQRPRVNDQHGTADDEQLRATGNVTSTPYSAAFRGEARFAQPHRKPPGSPGGFRFAGGVRGLSSVPRSAASARRRTSARVSASESRCDGPEAGEHLFPRDTVSQPVHSDRPSAIFGSSSCAITLARARTSICAGLYRATIDWKSVSWASSGLWER